MSVHSVTFLEHPLLPGTFATVRDRAANQTAAAPVSMELLFCGRWFQEADMHRICQGMEGKCYAEK